MNCTEGNCKKYGSEVSKKKGGILQINCENIVPGR